MIFAALNTQRGTEMRKTWMAGLAASALLAAPAYASSGVVSFELPRLKVRTYHKPYIAIWLEDAKGKQVKVYRVFYDVSKIGGRWLPDLKTWWRRGGRAMNMPVDGVSRPTRGPGRYNLNLGSMNNLPAGQYAIVVEAAREKGGREILKLPFSWRPGQTVKGSASGSREVGRVSVIIE